MMTRREALTNIYKVIVAIGASTFFSFEDLMALESKEFKKPNLLWLHASSCSGCSTSFLNIEDVSVVDLLTKYTNVLFHPDISLATGHQVVELLEKAKNEKFIFVLEGSVPVAMPHACMMGEKPMMEWVEEIGHNAIASIAVGTCASFGGVTFMSAMETGTQTLDEFYKNKSIKSPVVNLPNCPLKPEHLLYVLFYYIKMGRLPELDSRNRPKKFFCDTVHEKCMFYSDFQENNFAKKIGDNGCMFHLGCQGIITKSDCSVMGHNGNTNSCIRAGHPCIGCASEQFPRQIMMKSYSDKRYIKRLRSVLRAKS